MAIERKRILQWLNEWQAHINAAAYEAARLLFSPDVVAFGTVAGVMNGLPELEERQWRQVWPRIKEFHFETEAAAIFASGSSELATVACQWHSLGQDRSSWYERRGRVTLVLRATADGLTCIHSHFSMEPGIPALGAPAER